MLIRVLYLLTVRSFGWLVLLEMGDAVLGLAATTDLADPPPWVIIRNASDPQIDGSLTLRQQAATAARIYEKYGHWITVNSAITTWAGITDLL